jgi:hypothetical protein
MQQQRNDMSKSLKRELRGYDLILSLRRHFLLIFASSLLFFAAFFWYSGGFFQYESRVLVDVSPAPVFLTQQEGIKQFPEIFRSSEYVLRVLQFAHSNAMCDHLIEKFDLYRHYGLPADSAKSYNKVCLILNHVIQARKSIFENVVISVRDNDRDLAARMADEVAMETDRLARRYFATAYAGRVDYYSRLLERLNEDFDKRNKAILDGVAAIREGSKGSGHPQGETLTLTENNLVAASAQLKDILDQLVEVRKSQEWWKSIIQSEKYQLISVMQKAIPDTTNLLIKRAVISLVAWCMYLLMVSMAIYFYYTYKSYGRLFLFGQRTAPKA